MKPRAGPRLVRRGTTLLLALIAAGQTGRGEASYLLISSPENQVVYYARLLTAAEQALDEPMFVAQLTREGQLKKPMGLAMDSLRKVLYVADAGVLAVVALPLRVGGSKVLALEGEPVTMLGGISPHGVAVDHQGALLCSDTTSEGSRILLLSAKDVVARLRGEESGNPVELYSAKASAPVHEPQGVAVDGRLLFWTNLGNGALTGSLVRGVVAPTDEGFGEAAQHLADDTDGAYGVCLTGTRAFFTDDSGNVRSLRKVGGTISKVSSGLTQPRGCAWDGDGTVFVANQVEGRVYSLSGGGSNTDERPLALAAEVPGAYGLAVFFSGSGRPAAVLQWSALAAFSGLLAAGVVA